MMIIFGELLIQSFLFGELSCLSKIVVLFPHNLKHVLYRLSVNCVLNGRMFKPCTYQQLTSMVDANVDLFCFCTGTFFF